MRQPKLYRTPDAPRFVGGYNWRPLAAWLFVTIAFMWAATQFTAYRLNYQPALGAGIHRAGTMAVYEPWMVLVWLFKFSDAPGQAKNVLMQGGFIAALGAMGSVFLALWLNGSRHRGQEGGAED